MFQSKFIAFEGINGSGKTTQSKILYDNLTKQGYDVVLVTEPGSTPIGEEIRNIVKSTYYGESSPITQLMLYNAARSELIRNIIIPSLLDGKIVISDRYIASSMAYQSSAQGLHPDIVRNICNIATNNLKPDLTILLDMPIEKALLRTVSRNIDDPKLDMNIEFHQKVQNGFIMEYMLSENNSWTRINAEYDICSISSKIEVLVNTNLDILK